MKLQAALWLLILFLPHYSFTQGTEQHAAVSGTVLHDTMLSDFSAEIKSGKQVELTWTVSPNEKLTTFDIQYSTNGEQFLTLARMKGNYNWNFQHSATSPGRNYYRLRITDTNGNVSYTPVQVVSFPGLVRVFPNPVKNFLTIEAEALSRMRLLNVEDEIRQQELVQGTNRIDLTEVPDGYYLLELYDGKGLVCSKIIIVSR